MTEFPFKRRDLLRVTGAGLLGTTGVGAAQTTGTQETSGGDLVWEFTQPSGGVFSSPTVADGTVYVGDGNGNLYAVDAATGDQEWAFTQPSDWVFSSPTVADGTVYVGSDDKTLYAVDAATGNQEWAFTQPSGEVQSSPTVADGTVYVGSDDSNLYAVDAATGSQEWVFTQPSDVVLSSPTVYEGTVYVGFGNSTLYAVDADSGSQEWAFTQPSNVVLSSPTVYEGTVYVGSHDSTLYAVDADSGSQEWAFTQPSDWVQSSPTVADGTVYVGSRDNNLYAVDAATGDQEWEFTQPSGRVQSSPTVADGTVYVGSGGIFGFDDSTLYAVDAATGEQEWAFTQPSGPVQSSPTIVDGTVYVGSGDIESNDSTLYAVDAGVEGSSEGSRVRLRTLGHHDENIGQPPGGGETDEVWSQQQKLTASDGDFRNKFGGSVGLSDDGTTALIGASRVDDRTGSAYVFSRSEGAWSQQQKLTAADGDVDDNFGESVGLSDDGTTALIGASRVDGRTGSAYVFSRSESAWSQQQKLTASDGEIGERFGWSVGLSDDGTTALIGAANDDNPNGEDAVSAYVFSRSEGAWSQQQKLTASDGDVDDVFGSSVGLSDDGTTALIAAPRLLRTENNGHAGSAYVFSRSEGAWSQQQKLTASDGERDFFGRSVGLSDDGTTALIGAADGESPNGRLTGSAYVFSRSEGAWSQQQKLTASDGERSDIFGESVGLSDDGTTALIGATGDDDDTGSAYVFSRSEGAWSQQQKLTASDGESSDSFGSSVGLSDDGTTALIGAEGDEDDNDYTGSAYVFSKNGSLAGAAQKLSTAEKIDSHSSLAAIESISGTTLDVDERMTQETINALESAVQDGSIDPVIAEEAITRLQTLEDASLLTVDRLGPNGQAGIDIAERTARSTISIVVNLLLGMLVAKAAVVAGGGLIIKGTITLIADFVSHFLGLMIGSDEDRTTDLKQEADRRCREEAQGIIQEIQQGALSGGREIKNRIDTAVDAIVDVVADGFRTIAELDGSGPLFTALENSTTNPPINILTTGDGIYQSLRRLNDSMKPDQISDGLQGSTTTATTAIESAKSSVDDGLTDAADLLDQVGEFSAELNLYKSFEDLLTSDESPLRKISDMLATLFATVKDIAIGLLTGAGSALSGYELIAFLKIIHGQMATAAIEGREVAFING